MSGFENAEQQPGLRDIDQLMAARQEVYLLGGNDAEIPAIDRVIASFKNGEITSEQALAEIGTIQSGKQDYH